MSDDLGSLKTMIADDLVRNDLTAQIAQAVSNAINTHRMERFYFNEDRSVSFNTTAGQEFYTSVDNASIPNLYEIDSLRLTVNGSRYQINPYNYAELDRIATLNTATGYPSVYARYGQQIRLYPIPNGTYAVNISAHVMLPDLGGDSSVNAWTRMSEAGNLIRYEAEAELYRIIIKDQESATAAEGYAMRQLDRLRRETDKRVATGRIMPTDF